ncbi:hypothetical protein VU04_05640 [Desulfobulbus sp. TB]|nr:hypothetical protein [Desulfobulbus sp. TB]
MNILTEKRLLAQRVGLFVALLCLLPLNTVHAASGSNLLSEIITNMQPVIQPMIQSVQPVQPVQPVQARQHQIAAGTCNARYEVMITEVNGMPMNKVISFGDFQSHGDGRMPRKAAKHAKQIAERCMQTQWYSEQDGIPYECLDQQGVSGYHIQDFDRTLRREICQSLKPLPCDRGEAAVRYSIFSVVEGEQGCGTRMNVASRTLLDRGVQVQCKCRQRRQLPAPQQVSPVQGTVFHHIPRHTLVAWQPVRKAKSYAVEVKYNGRLWTTLNTTGEATFVTFDFPGAGQGEWRVIAQGRSSMNGTASPWASFSYQR